MEQILTELAADYASTNLELLSVHLTRAEHLVVIGALNRVLFISENKEARDALKSLLEVFQENVEDWAELQSLKRGKA